MPGDEPPPQGFAGLGHRQVLACLLAAFAAGPIARHWLVPRLQQRVADGLLQAPQAIESAAASAGGLMLACLGGALLACTLYNRLARERARRRQARAREITFLTSLGHSLPGPRPSSDRQSQD
jgi:hypothetical protein